MSGGRVLDAEHAAVVEGVEPVEHRAEVDGAARIVDVHLGRAAHSLAELHVIRELEQLARIAAPVGDVTGVDQ